MSDPTRLTKSIVGPSRRLAIAALFACSPATAPARISRWTTFVSLLMKGSKAAVLQNVRRAQFYPACVAASLRGLTRKGA